MVLGEMFVTNPNSTAFCASKRTVQWSWPSGDGLQATAIRWAVCKPERTLRRCCCTLSCKTASTPPSPKRLRTLPMVARQISKAAVIWSSLQPSDSFSATLARVIDRALAFPRWTNTCKCCSSASVSFTASFMDSLLISLQLTTSCQKLSGLTTSIKSEIAEKLLSSWGV